MKLKFSLLTAILFIIALLLTSCNAKGGENFISGFDSDMALDYSSGAEGAGTTNGGVGDSAEGSSNRPSGLITAAAWNDNENYEYWKTLFMQSESDQTGKFFSFHGDSSWGFTSLNRIKVTVKNGDSALAGAIVVAKDVNQSVLFNAVTDSNGVAYLFTDVENGEITITASSSSTTVDFTNEERDLVVELSDDCEKMNIIELMFVVDVTGSMGDELEYLKNEISDVVSKVALSNEGVEINLALLFYRDTTDKQPSKYHDFVNVTTTEGMASVIAAIDAQSASGGGDYAEAVDTALEDAVNKQWSTGATTKIIFQILDAPPHSGANNKTTFNSAVHTAAEKGIRICPIICSGADTLTEYVMREAAIYTSGTFVFVTDDSGIGNSHHDPELPNVTIEALNALLIRLINGYHTGEFKNPINWRQQ